LIKIFFAILPICENNFLLTCFFLYICTRYF
jgi:hypothetical protein